MHFLKFRHFALRAGLLGLLALCSGQSVFAQAKGDVAVNLAAKKVVADTKGKESLQSADKARPGDVIQYDAVYSNTGKGAVKSLQATMPIPEGLELIADSTKPSGALASLDGKTFTPMPVMREVAKPDGTREMQPVPLAEYRSLRWSIVELAPGKSATVTARARMLTNSPQPK